MKKFTKILSAVLALVMVIAVCVMPASAAPEDVKITAEVVATLDGQTNAGLNVYKIEVFVESTHSLASIQCNMSYDSSAFQIVRATNHNQDASAINANMVLDKTDTDAVFNTVNSEYDEYGGFYDGDDNLKEDYGYAMFPADGTQPTIAKISDTNLGSTLLGQGYTGTYWTYSTDFTDNYLLVSGGSYSGNSRPHGGKVKLFTYYLREKADAAEGTYSIGFNADQYRLLTGTYTTNDVLDSLSIGPNMASIQQTMVTYNNATVTIGEEDSSIINPYKDQIRFKGQGNGAYENSFDVRVLAQITEDDLVETFGDTATKVGPSDVIESAGFIFERVSQGSNGTLTLEAAKEYLEGSGSLGGTWAEVSVNTISTAFKSASPTPADYVISCLITDIPDASKTDGVNAVGYVKGVDGTVYCYPAVYTTTFSTLYDAHFSTAFPG